jgi:hypothetical protein
MILLLVRQAIVEANMCWPHRPTRDQLTLPMRLDSRFKPSAIICWILLPHLAKPVRNP